MVDRVLDSIGGVLSMIFVVYGIFHLTRINGAREVQYVNDLNFIAVGFFLIFFNGLAAVLLLAYWGHAGKTGLAISTYFGYLVSWTGRGLHFLAMGFYLYPAVCYMGPAWTTRQCYNHIDFDGKVTLVALFTSLVLGTVFLLIRAFVTKSDHEGSSVTYSRLGVDAGGILAMIASCGMLLWAVLKLLLWFDNYQSQFVWYYCYDFAVIVVVSMFAVFSALSCLRISIPVASYFGFLYNGLGRGCFYVLMGMYMYGMNPYPDIFKNDARKVICSTFGIVSIIVGILHLLLHCLVLCRPSQTWFQHSAAYTTRHVSVGIMRRPFWQEQLPSHSVPIMQVSIGISGSLPKTWSLAMSSAVVFYAAVGVVFMSALVSTMMMHPLVPLKMESAAWANAWLIMTIGDYYATALCLCGIVLATEGVWFGILWVCGILFFGSGVSCIYMIYRCLSHKTLSLTSKSDAHNEALNP